MSLESVQHAFAAALFDGERAAALLPSLAAVDAMTLQRIGLYRGNLVAAWQKALANAFPVVQALVGEAFFDALARVYGHAHPGTNGDLNRFGDQLAGFVAEFEHTRPLPYLPDVAALEWLVHRAHYAADATALPRTRIAALQPQQLLAARFDLHPACAWLGSRYPVAQIWLAHQPHPPCKLPDSLESGEMALVVRPRWRVEVVRSSMAEVAALGALRAGAPLQEAIESAIDEDPVFDLAQALVRWLDLGLLSGLRGNAADGIVV